MLFISFKYGDEHKLAGFSATLLAIVSFVENRCRNFAPSDAGPFSHLVLWLSNIEVCIVADKVPGHVRLQQRSTELLLERVTSIFFSIIFASWGYGMLIELSMQISYHVMFGCNTKERSSYWSKWPLFFLSIMFDSRSLWNAD